MEAASPSVAPATAPTEPPAAPQEGPAVPGGRSRDVLRLGAKVLALLLGAAAVLLGLVVLVPDGNDYALATRKKHARLAAPASRKIVLIGGSNLAYGIDSARIEGATGAHVVNMGMNGYLGVRYMLAEVKAALRHPDVAVIALEYDSFIKSVDGTGTDLLMITKANPAAFGFLTWGQRRALLEAIPFAAQQKVLRVLRETGRGRKPSLMDEIETLAGFNEHGDLVSHFGVKWPVPIGDGMDLTRTPVDGEVIGLLRSFGEEMSARGVKVVVSYTSVLERYYDTHKQAIDNLHRLLTQSPPLVVPSPPSEFVYPEPLFFDTVYHVNQQGRAVRTERLIRDLKENVR